MAQPAGLDAATIGAFQNYLGLPATMVWDDQTDAAFHAFQLSKGWGETYGLTGNQQEWEFLTDALRRNDRSKVVNTRSDVPADQKPTDTGGQTTPTGTGSDGQSKANNSARALIEETLREWGLDSLSGWAWDQIQQGNSELLPTLIRQTAEYKDRFKGLEMRRAKGLNVMSESQYIQLENDYRTIMHSYGLPQGVFDSQDYLAGMIAGDLSPNELNDRLRIYQDAMYSAPMETRDALSRLYGADEGSLLAYYIDPERALPVLEAQYKASSAAAAAQRAGFATFDRATAERLAQLGADKDSFTTFANLRDSRELFTALGATEGGDQSKFSDSQAAEAAFGGDAIAQDTIVKRAQTRKAAYAGGGSFAASQKGAFGIGAAE